MNKTLVKLMENTESFVREHFVVLVVLILLTAAVSFYILHRNKETFLNAAKYVLNNFEPSLEPFIGKQKNDLE